MELPKKPRPAHGWVCELANEKVYESERAAYAAEARAWLYNEFLTVREVRESGFNWMHVTDGLAWLLREHPHLMAEIAATAKDCAP